MKEHTMEEFNEMEMAERFKAAQAIDKTLSAKVDDVMSYIRVRDYTEHSEAQRKVGIIVNCIASEVIDYFTRCGRYKDKQDGGSFHVIMQYWVDRIDDTLDKERL